MTVHEGQVELFAENFYRFHGVLAPDFGFGGNYDSRWEELTSNEKKRIVAAARLALVEVGTDESATGEGFFQDWPSGGTEGRECGS